jgi:predicted MFS family arabinose efflux permease
MIAAALMMGCSELMLVLIAISEARLALGAIALALVGFATTNTMSTANTLVQTAALDDLRGRVMAVYMTVFAGSIPIGALFAGWVTGQIGAPASLAMGGTMVIVAGLIQIWSTRHARLGKTVRDAPAARAAD